MPLTQKELAKKFNVSQMTISRALRGDEGVTEQLKQSIVAFARERGYTLQTHHEARVLRQRARGQTRINNVFCAIVWQGESDDELSFHGKIQRGIREASRELGTEILLSGHVLDELPLVVTRGQVDGVIRLPGDDDIAAGRVTCPLPWVSLLYDIPGVDLVGIDNRAGALEVGRHLCSLGHRRIGFIGPSSAFAFERLEGIRAACRESGAEPPLSLLRRSGLGEESTTILLDELLQALGGELSDLHHHFTALVAYNDYMAVSALRYFSRRGLRVPEDLSIAGFDGALPLGFRQPQVTTAAIPLEDLGGDAVRLLAWRLAHPEAPRRRLFLETRLVPGETASFPRSLAPLSRTPS